MEQALKVVDWVDSGRKPQCKPNPDFPTGKDIDISHNAVATCSIRLPYPAPRCGVFIVECETCHQRVGVTTAGRPDDPRSLKLACGLPSDPRSIKLAH